MTRGARDAPGEALVLLMSIRQLLPPGDAGDRGRKREGEAVQRKGDDERLFLAPLGFFSFSLSLAQFRRFIGFGRGNDTVVAEVG